MTEGTAASPLSETRQQSTTEGTAVTLATNISQQPTAIVATPGKRVHQNPRKVVLLVSTLASQKKKKKLQYFCIHTRIAS